MAIVATLDQLLENKVFLSHHKSKSISKMQNFQGK